MTLIGKSGLGGKLKKVHQRVMEAVMPSDAGERDSLLYHRVSLMLYWLYIEVVWGFVFCALYSGIPNARLAQGTIIAAVVLSVTIAPLLIRRRAFVAAGNWIVFTLCGSLLTVIVATGGLQAPTIAWLVILPVAASILANRRSGLVWATMSTFIILALFFSTHYLDFPFEPLDAGTASISTGVALTAALVFLGLLGAQHQYLRALLIERVRNQAGDVDAVLASAPDAVFALDGNGCVTRCSQAAVRLFGYKGEQMASLSIKRLIPTCDLASLEESLSGPAPAESHTGVASNGDEFPLSVTMARYGFSNPRYVVIARDIRAERRLELELRQSQKMEAVGRLAGGVAHDFNNLLSIIAGHAEFLRDVLDEDPQASEDLDVLLTTVGRGACLVEQMLTYSRGEVAGPDLLDVSDGVSTAATMLRRILGSGIELDVVSSSQTCLAKIHRTHLEQIIFNLALNARDAMPNGGVLTLRTRRAESDVDGQPWSVIEITDTGIGMSRETLGQVFEPFFTTKGVGEGTGFGLATTDRIVREAGGFIEVQTEPDAGTTFSVWLPFARGAVQATVGPGELVVASAGRVLVIEDEQSLRRLARRILESRGFEVIDARDGQEAVELVRSYLHPIDLIFSDVVMPRLGGIEAVRLIREYQPDVPAIFVSGFPREAQQQIDALQRDRFMMKPYTPRTLLEMIEQVLASHEHEEAT